MAKKTETNAQLKKQITALKSKNNKLEKKLSTKKQKNGKSAVYWLRSLLSVFLMFMAAATIVTSISFLWLHNTVLDTDTWVENTTEIITTEAVADDISNDITTELFEQIDLNQYVAEVLPERAKPLSGPIASGVEGFVGDKANEFIKSQTFVDLWTDINRNTHAFLVESIESIDTVDKEKNQDSLVFIDGDSLMLNLRPILDDVKSNLVSKGLTFLPQESVVSQDQVTFQVAHVENLSQSLDVYNSIESLKFWLPVIGVLFAVAGVLISTKRRRSLLILSILVLVLAVLEVQLIKAGQHAVSQAVINNTQGLSSESTSAVYKILTDSLITSLRWLMAAFLLIAVFVILTGPSKLAKKIRDSLGGLFKNYKKSGFINWLGTNAVGVITGVSLAVAAFIVLAPTGSPAVAVWLIILDGVLAVFLLAIKNEINK